MPKISGISQRDAVRVFQKLGYRIARQSGHIIMSNGRVRLTIPRHSPINALTKVRLRRMRDLRQRNFANSCDLPLSFFSVTKMERTSADVV